MSGKIRSIHPGFFADVRKFPPSELDVNRWPKGGISPHYVYYLIGGDGRCVYVGITWDPLTRLRAHRSGRWWSKVHVIQVAAVEDEITARRIEKVLIACHQPTENRLRYKDGA